MILFKKEHVEKILSGKKTQTRRLGKKRWNVDAIHQARLNYFDEPFARLRILEVSQERILDISKKDAMAEGYGSIDEFHKAFLKIHPYHTFRDYLIINDLSYSNPLVWVVKFEVA